MDLLTRKGREFKNKRDRRIVTARKNSTLSNEFFAGDDPKHGSI
jgi:hypothetical protein